MSPELEELFRQILMGAERDPEHQSYVMLLMQMLADGEPLPALSDVLRANGTRPDVEPGRPVYGARRADQLLRTGATWIRRAQGDGGRHRQRLA